MSGGSTKEKIEKLRFQNKSYKQIASLLGISKGTISYWLSKNIDSQVIKKRLTQKNIRATKLRIRKIIESNQRKWTALWAEAEAEAGKEFKRLIGNPLFVAGISIYWGEGDSKVNNPIRVSNTDPRMIAAYCMFLRVILKIPEGKMRVGLILYPDLGNDEAINFWSGITKISRDKFVKSQYIQGNHPTSRLEHGICMVVVSDKFQKVKILKWIDLFAKKITM